MKQRRSGLLVWGATDRVASWFVRRAGLARFATIALATGIAMAAFGGPGPATVGACLVVAVSLLTGSVIAGHLGLGGGRLLAVVVVSVLLLGLASGYLIGGVRVLALQRGALSAQIGRSFQVRLTVTGQVKSSGNWQSATAEVITASTVGPGSRATVAGAAGQRVLLQVNAKGVGGAELAQGAIVETLATVETPQGKSASGFDQKSYLRNQEIAVVLTSGAADLKVVGSRGGITGWFDRLRVSAKDHLSRGPDARLDEVLQGIVTGDTVGIDDGWTEAFRRSGTAHMLSVSGLHVASLAAIMMGLARLARAPRRVGFLLAGAASLLMIPFVGASPPVVRSVIMILIVLAGRMFGRRRDQWQVLALAAAVVLALNPYSLFDVGFQLSFAAFAGMLLFVSPLQRALHALPSGVADNVAVSVAASAGTAPVSLAAFGRISLVAVAANLVVVPLLTVVTGLGMLSILVGYLWHGLSAVADYAVAPAVAWIVQASRFFARAPVLETGKLWRAGLALCGGLLAAPAVLAVAGWRLPGPLDALVPGLWRARRWMAVRRRRARGKAVAVCAVLVLFAMAIGWLVYPSLQHGVLRSVAAVEGGWPSCLEVRVLDVGQGNAILIRTPDHHAVLCDGGPAGCNLGFQLRMLGVESLDAICITHPHADHFAGLLECAKDLKVKTIIDGVEVVQSPQSGQATTGKSSGFVDSGQEARNYVELRRQLASRGCAHVLACTGQSATIGGLKLSFFAPAESIRLAAAPTGASSTQGQESNPWLRPARAPTGDELNGDSVVVVAEWQGYKFLLPGDAEAEVLRSYDLPTVDVVVVPHHGSRGAVSSELLKRLQVRAAAISVGRQNTFGHPDPETVSCLRQGGLAILRTDQRGWICFDVVAGQLREASER